MPRPPVRCRNINLWPGRVPCGNQEAWHKIRSFSLIALMNDNMSRHVWRRGWVGTLALICEICPPTESSDPDR